MERIDVSAELLTLDSDRYYADWSIEKTIVKDSVTEVIIRVSSFADAEYVDMTPIFEIIANSKETVGSQFYLKEVTFNPMKKNGELILISEDIRSNSSCIVAEYEETMRTSGSYTIEQSVLKDINYKNPPILVGYCGERKKLAVESRN